MKDILSNIVAVIWFFGVLLGTIIFGIFGLMMILGNMKVMLVSGFATSPYGYFLCFMGGIIFAITGWVPAFRKCYFKLPWLYPFGMMLMMNMFVLAIAESILAEGFSVIDESRHTIAIGIVIVQLVACRLLMCLYLKKMPMVLHKYDVLE